MVTFKENIKPREVNREPGRSYLTKEVGRERREYNKGITASKNDGKKDNNNKRKNETKKCGMEKMQEMGKQNVAVQVRFVHEKNGYHPWGMFSVQPSFFHHLRALLTSYFHFCPSLLG